MPSRGQRLSQTNAERMLALTAQYQTLPGIYDELMDERGEPREHWKPVLATLADLGPRELARRFGQADQYLRDSGVFYRVYDDPMGKERTWPLAHVPLVIAPEEWKALSKGLAERAALLDTVLSDLYGPATLVREGLMPAAAFAGSPDYLRTMAGVNPRGGGHLWVYAVDVGRGPDGRWWVLSDRAQAPSGAGYALENRLAMSRALPEIYARLNVERLAGFFERLRAQFSALAETSDKRVCVLTPGPLNETYFEHAFLARYLGFLLVEGADLTVRDDQLYVRTVSGLKRTDMVWRRLDADFADPLELNAQSRLGVPGLMAAVRAGKVTLANALGAGLIESRSLLAFLPGIAQARLGRDLAIPHVATWWCGQPIERGAVVADLQSFVVAPAVGTRVPGVLEDGAVLAGELSPEEQRRLAEELTLRGADFVAQEIVKLSTMPVWTDGRLAPRPFTLRLLLTKIGGEWTVMPGGFCRIGSRIDARAVTMQSDGLSADVCVLAEGPVEQKTLLPAPDKIDLRSATAALPSRAADNLFWLGRYVERAEATLRLLRALDDQMSAGEAPTAEAPRRLIEMLTAWEALPETRLPVDPATLRSMVLHGRSDGALPSITQGARYAASAIRDRFSPDAWATVVDLAAVFEPRSDIDSGRDAYADIAQGLRLTAAFSGLAQENMNQHSGWRFLKLGKRLERTLATCRYVRQFADPKAGANGLDVLLTLADSQITFRRRYVMVPARGPVIDLVLMDSHNPRAVAFQIERMIEHLKALPDHNPDGRLTSAEKLMLKVRTDLQIGDPFAIETRHILAIEQRLMALSDEISTRYFTLRDDMPSYVETLG